MERKDTTRQVRLGFVVDNSPAKPAEQLIETKNLISRISMEMPCLNSEKGSVIPNLIRSVLGLKHSEGLPINLTVREAVLILESAVHAQQNYFEGHINRVRRKLIKDRAEL